MAESVIMGLGEIMRLCILATERIAKDPNIEKMSAEDKRHYAISMFIQYNQNKKYRKY